MSGTWVVVLVKDFGQAKRRLGGVLDPHTRFLLATELAGRAVDAARVADRVLVVAGSTAAAAAVARDGIDVLVETEQCGQNPAAATGIAEATRLGATTVVVLSSDLPLVDRAAVRALLDRLPDAASAGVVAAEAYGRGGTNALLLRPPTAIPMCFGEDSLRRFTLAAGERGVPVLIHRDPRLALDLDEPGDLRTLAGMQRSA